MSFPTYINFQVNNTGEGRSNMVVHRHAVILMLLSLCPESFRIFFLINIVRSRTLPILCMGSVENIEICIEDISFQSNCPMGQCFPVCGGGWGDTPPWDPSPPWRPAPPHSNVFQRLLLYYSLIMTSFTGKYAK